MKTVPTTVCFDPASLAPAGDDVQWLVAILVVAMVLLFVAVAHNETDRARRFNARLRDIGSDAVARAVRPD